LKSVGVAFESYKSGRPKGKVLLVGAFDPPQVGNPLVVDILEWVNNGNSLVVIGNTEKWAGFLAKKEVADYRGAQVLGTVWYGGNFFVKEHALFEGLPQSCVFNWEYQCLAGYNKSRSGLRMFNGETVVGCVADHKPEVYAALSIIPHGRGKIILCTLDIMSCIKDAKAESRAEGDGENAAINTFNASSKNNANIVAQQLLLNMIRYK
jgi:beta-galactosidase